VSFTSVPSRVAHIQLAEALAHEQVLELRGLLEVVLLVAELEPCRGRDGDVDVSALETAPS